MSIKKWLQLSDVHFGSPDSFPIERMREHFIEKCSQLSGIDYLFLTGDFRYGKLHPDKYPDGTIEFLQNVQKNLGISPCNTFMVPGNHDILRVGGRTSIIDEIKKQYLPRRTIPDNYTPNLNPSREHYLNLYQQICDEARTENHFFVEKDDLNIIHINTAILCGKDGEDGSLVIDMLALQRSLNGIDRTKPAIAIAHHPFNCLEDEEQMQLEILLKNFNTILFLCGHRHATQCRNIHTMKPNINLWEYVCGTNMDNTPHENPAEIGFFTGYIDTKSKSGYVEGHKWSKRHNAWMPNDDFSFPQEGACDGKYHFPKRITCEPPIFTSISEDELEDVRDKYLKYLERECTFQADGLPMPQEVLLRNIALEEMFVPLRFGVIPAKWDEIKSAFDDSYINAHKDWFGVTCPIPDEDDKINRSFRTIIFSGPGGGKTIFMKRLVSAYGLGKIDDAKDNLPKRSLFPIWIKCRDFNRPLAKLIKR